MPITRVKNHVNMPRPLTVVNTTNQVTINYRNGGGQLYFLTPGTAVTANWRVDCNNMPTSVGEATDFIVQYRILYQNGASALDPQIWKDGVNLTSSFTQRTLGASTNSVNILDLAWMYRNSTWFLYYQTRPLAPRDLVDV